VRTIAGQRAGDQRWDIVRAGDSVVVGWGQVWANAIAGGAPRLLGPVVTFVPAAEARAVWLVNYPGARIGEGTPTLSEVTTTGRVIQSELGPPALSGVPIVGIPGGLAFESRTGIAFWNAEQRAFVRYLGSRAGFIGNAAHGQVAWCEGLCTSLHVTAVVGSDKEFPSPQSRQAFEPDSVRLSPDGRYVAAITTREGLGTANQLGSLNVIDTRTGHVDVVRDRVSVWSTMTWTADSRTVFFASDNSSGMTVGKFRVGTRNADTAEIPIRNAEQFVIVNRSAAKVILSRVAHEPASACSPMVASSDSSPGCAFGY
jgi:sugar lactone lactonase YvrE